MSASCIKWMWPCPDGSAPSAALSMRPNPCITASVQTGGGSLMNFPFHCFSHLCRNGSLNRHLKMEIYKKSHILKVLVTSEVVPKTLVYELIWEYFHLCTHWYEVLKMHCIEKKNKKVQCVGVGLTQTTVKMLLEDTNRYFSIFINKTLLQFKEKKIHIKRLFNLHQKIKKGIIKSNFLYV